MLFSSVRARLAFRRKPAISGAETGDVPEPAPADEVSQKTAAARSTRVRLPRALLASRPFWLAASGALLLGIAGALAAMLWHSAHEKTALQEKLKQTRVPLKTPGTPATPPKPAAPPSAARLPSQPEGAPPPADPSPAPARQPETPAKSRAGGHCNVSDRESVARNLKQCIESFNQQTESGRR